MSTTGTLHVTTPSPTEIVMTRTFAAERGRVFDAFTKPDLLRRWLGRAGDEMTVCEVDLRVGGTYRYEFRLRADEHAPAGAARVIFRETGSFREIDRPARIVATESFDDYPGETVLTTTFLEDGGRTTITASSSYASPEIRDSVIAAGVERGAAESYDRLAALLGSD